MIIAVHEAVILRFWYPNRYTGMCILPVYLFSVDLFGNIVLVLFCKPYWRKKQRYRLFFAITTWVTNEDTIYALNKTLDVVSKYALICLMWPFSQQIIEINQYNCSKNNIRPILDHSRSQGHFFESSFYHKINKTVLALISQINTISFVIVDSYL